MKISKTVLGLVMTGVLLAGSQKVSKAEEGTEAVKEVKAEAVSAPVVEAPAPAPVVEVPAPAPVTETPAPAPAAEGATEVSPAPEVKAPVTSSPAVVPAHSENKEESAQPVVLSVAELYAKKAEMNGKNVTVFGKVVKVNVGVMGRNWIHIQDGTGAQGSNDITVTTDGHANVNDKVSGSGKVAVDRDFGGGYKYSVIIEEAVIKVQ
jgi:hypothetical protein